MTNLIKFAVFALRLAAFCLVAFISYLVLAVAYGWMNGWTM